MIDHSSDASTGLAAWQIPLGKLGLQSIGLELLRSGTSSQAVGTGEYVVLKANSNIDPESALYCYHKQQWCAQQGLNAGVNTVPITEVKRFSEGVFAVLPKAIGIEGQSLIDRKIESSSACAIHEAEELGRRIMQGLGKQAQILHGIELEGFGPLQLSQHGKWAGTFPTWDKYVASRISSLVISDDYQDTGISSQLLAKGVITSADLDLIKEKLKEIYDWNPDPVLCHLDLRPCNSIVNGEEVQLIDWGMAKSDAGVRAELGAFMSCGLSPSPDQCEAFLVGYGVEPQQRASVIADAKLLVIENALSCAQACVQDPGSDSQEWCSKWLEIIKQNLCSG